MINEVIAVDEAIFIDKVIAVDEAILDDAANEAIVANEADDSENEADRLGTWQSTCWAWKEGSWKGK